MKTSPATQSAPKYEMFSFKDLANVPRLQWLIRGLLLEKIASVISADSGAFKSFFALIMALCVSTGRDFFGRDVKQGTAVYVAAEGFFTLHERAVGWAQEHDCELPENFHILKAPINLADEKVIAAFADTIRDLNPALVVLDTLSQCAVGANENDNADMADFVRGMMMLCDHIGAHVTVLHHNGKHTGTFRGASSIHANVDARIAIETPEGDEQNTVFIHCEKQRGKKFESFALRGREIELPFTDEYGDKLTTLFFEPCGEDATKKHSNSKKADKTAAALMEAFDQVACDAAQFNIEGVKIGFWKEKAVECDPPICSDSAFWRHRKALEKSGAIEECGSHNGSVLWRRAHPTVTTPNDSTDSQPACAQSVTVTTVIPFRDDSNDSNDSSRPTITLIRAPKPKANDKNGSEPYAALMADDPFEDHE